MACSCRHALLASLHVALCSTTHIHLNYHLCLAQIVIAVMYFTRWHVSSEFLSVAIAAQVTMSVHINEATHSGAILTVLLRPGSLPGRCRRGLQCCTCVHSAACGANGSS
jgi:hypothetical protein